MRPIKFRYIYSNGKDFIFQVFTLEQIHNAEPCDIVMDKSKSEEYKLTGRDEWTGLTDRNGVEIYENDRVKILYTDWASKSSIDERTIEQYLNDIAETKIVIWSYNGFYVSNEVGGYAESMEYGKHGYIEVIGNIHTEKK